MVPNGVLPAIGRASPEEFLRRFGTFPFVLSVGRIEPRKNTLGLIRGGPAARAAAGGGGRSAAGVRALRGGVPAGPAGDRTIWLGRLDHDDPLLASAYAAARVFALPSWFETPGLAALEAALAGCAVVDHAIWVDPGVLRRSGRVRTSGTAWRDCAGRSRSAGRTVRDPDLAERVESRYLWPRVARMIAEVYDSGWSLVPSLFAPDGTATASCGGGCWCTRSTSSEVWRWRSCGDSAGGADRSPATDPSGAARSSGRRRAQHALDRGAAGCVSGGDDRRAGLAEQSRGVRGRPARESRAGGRANVVRAAARNDGGC